MSEANSVIAIIPCNNLDASEAFYNKLGFKRHGYDDEYRILFDGRGAQIHLTKAVEGWLIPGRNPFGIYFNAENVEDLAKEFGVKPEHKPWSMYEFSLSDPDETFVRVGWTSALVKKKANEKDLN
jgi:catechol 2,3-dioxygenase-like lactoylglutathione lyase family enzyme